MEALAPQEAVDCGQNAGARGSHPCPASWLRIRGSGISHLESEDRCLHATLTSTPSATRFGWGPAPPGRPRGSPSFHQARYNGRLKPCSTCNRVKGKITPRQQGRSQLGAQTWLEPSAATEALHFNIRAPRGASADRPTASGPGVLRHCCEALRHRALAPMQKQDHKLTELPEGLDHLGVV